MNNLGKRIALVLSFLCFVSLIIIPAMAETTTWIVQTVDTNAYAWSNGYCPIVLDSKNNPHIAYTGFRLDPIGVKGVPTGLVMYARWNGTGLSTQQIAIGTVFSLVLDSNDNPHVLFGSGVPGSGFGPLMYASWTGYSWNIQTVDETFTNGFGVVALDTSGNPHVAYTNGNYLKYASGPSWNIQTVDSGLDTPLRLSFSLNSNNTPYIMYQTAGSKYVDNKTGINYNTINVRLATEKNTQWSIENISLPQPIHDLGNLALDSSGKPHFICTQYNFVSAKNMTIVKTLLYIIWNGSAWIRQPVISGDLSMGSLALDSKDYPHLSYIDQQPMYTRWIGTFWGTQIAGLSGNLIIDSNGKPHVSSLVNPPTGLDMRIAYVKYSTKRNKPNFYAFTVTDFNSASSGRH